MCGPEVIFFLNILTQESTDREDWLWLACDECGYFCLFLCNVCMNNRSPESGCRGGVGEQSCCEVGQAAVVRESTSERAGAGMGLEESNRGRQSRRRNMEDRAKSESVRSSGRRLGRRQQQAARLLRRHPGRPLRAAAWMPRAVRLLL